MFEPQKLLLFHPKLWYFWNINHSFILIFIKSLKLLTAAWHRPSYTSKSCSLCLGKNRFLSTDVQCVSSPIFLCVLSCKINISSTTNLNEVKNQNENHIDTVSLINTRVVDARVYRHQVARKEKRNFQQRL